VISLDSFLKNGVYLPPELRGFYAQKSLFRRIQEVSSRYKWGYLEKPPMQVAMCYTIDIFLWFMAKHGYTLQKTRVKVEGLKDFGEMMDEFEQQRQADRDFFLKAMVASSVAKPPQDSVESIVEAMSPED
jgi:hypothetical protein